ncbi:MAG: hypothetical protein GY878_02220 [Fuerstiella sp.]|nr:hypothetical protein [Fuerstiella sp.]
MSDRVDTADMMSLPDRSALIVGVTGIQGQTLASQLIQHGWNVGTTLICLACRPT